MFVGKVYSIPGLRKTFEKARVEPRISIILWVHFKSKPDYRWKLILKYSQIDLKIQSLCYTTSKKKFEVKYCAISLEPISATKFKKSKKRQ